LIRLSDDTRLRLADDNVWSQLGEEIVILDLASSSYLGLDDVGAAVWDMLTEPRRVDELEADIAAAYEVNLRDLSRDLRQFLEELVTRGLLVLDEEKSEPVP